MGKSAASTPEQRRRLHSILKSSYGNNKDAEANLAKEGYTLDKSLSGKRAKVFTDAEGKPKIVYKGTQSIQDVGTDIALTLGLGKHTKRFKHAKKVKKSVQEKYKTDNIDTYGHSLGGYLAENVGTKGKVTTYNKASVGEKVHNKGQEDVRTKHDLVSAMSPKHKGTTVLKGSRDVLATHNLDQLLK